jgi:hypothetical protein
MPGPSYGLLATLSESRLIPTRHHLGEFTAEQLAELGYLYLLGLRILLVEPATADWARHYCRKTARDKFATWLSDGTDLYNMLYGLLDQDVALKHPRASDAFRRRLRLLDPVPLRRWLDANASASTNEGATVRLFLNLDGMFRIGDAALRAVRRLVQDWPELRRRDRQLAMTRLLQLLRHRARSHSELLPQLVRAAQAGRLELPGVCDRDSGRNCAEGWGLLADLAAPEARLWRQDEAASAGATSAASIATVAAPLGGVVRREPVPTRRAGKRTPPSAAKPEPLGVGFDPDGDRGIYG